MTIIGTSRKDHSLPPSRGERPSHPAAGTSRLVNPQQLHFVEPLGTMRMQVEFYDDPPDLAAA
jgi:hypothetical protein